jgi:hypothetical protein
MMDSETDYCMTLSGTGNVGGNGGGGSLTAGKVHFKKTQKDRFKKLLHDLTRGARRFKLYCILCTVFGKDSIHSSSHQGDHE